MPPELSLTRQDLDEVEREYCKRGLANFIKLAWPVIEPSQPYVHGWHIDAICEHLQAVTRGEITRLLINIPPGTMKSLITGVFWPAWEWGPMRMQSQRYVAASHSQEFSIRDTLKMRRLVSSDWYQRLWPTPLTKDQNEKQKFENQATGFRQAMAMKSLTGTRGDCLLPWNVVDTDIGRLTIGEIVDRSISCYALSYEQHTKRLVYRPIQAVARRTSQDFYRVHTASGVLVECTGDHRIYTARGYVEARLLSADDVLLRVLPKGHKAQCILNEEAREKRPQENSVQSKMCTDHDKLGGWEARAELQRVRGENHKEAGMVLFSDVQGKILAEKHDKTGVKKDAVVNSELQDLQHADHAKNNCSRASILLEGVQGYSPFFSHEGGEEPGVAEWDERKKIHKSFAQAIPKDTRTDSGEGLTTVRGLFRENRLVRASHRHEPREQCVGQFSHIVPSVSCHSTFEGAFVVEGDSVAMVERVCESATVYDIQVEGTRCFFANGILVHNCVIIDDPHSVEGALSDADRKTTLRVFTETVPTRLNNPDKSAIVVVMQRLHEDDVSGFILANDHGYDHLMLPMELEPERKCVTRIGFEDPRTYEGELLFPERFPREVVDRDKKMMNTYAVAGQFQQRPSPRGGGLIKGASFSRYVQPPLMEFRSIYADTAQKTAERNDYSVFECWGYSGGKIYLLDLIRGKWEAPELKRRALEFWAKHNAVENAGMLRSLVVEDKASGTGLIQEIKSAGKIPVVAQQRTKDKYSRIMDVLSYIEAGLVCLPSDAPFTSDFVDECESFTSDDTHSHDDQIDPMIDAINDMLAKNKFAFWEDMT